MKNYETSRTHPSGSLLKPDAATETGIGGPKSPFHRIAPHLKRFVRSPLLHRSLLASVDQIVLSFANLAISVILLNTVPKLNYGYYSICFAIVLFTVAVQNAIISAPLAVLLNSKKGRPRRNYVGSLLYGQMLVTVPISVSGLIAGSVILFGDIGSWKGLILSSMACALVGILLREFFRSYHFAEELPAKVFKMDLAYILLTLAMLAGYHAWFGLTVAGVFILTGFASLVTSVIFGRLGVSRRGIGKVRESYAENWLIGKWALLGVIVTHIQNYSYLYITAGVLGGSIVADLAASRLLLSPLMLFKAAWSRIAIPRGARLRDEGRMDLFFKELIIANLLFLIGALCYLFLLHLLSDFLQATILPAKYDRVFQYAPIWAAVSLMGFIMGNASCGLQVIKEFKTITFASFFAMLLTVVLCYGFALRYGPAGVLAALLTGEAFLGAALWFFLRRRLKAGHFLKSRSERRKV